MNEFVVADSGIRQLHAHYIDAVWRKDAAAFAECFAKDSEWKIAGLHIRGRSDIGNQFARLLSVCARVRIILGEPILSMKQGTATGRIHVTELAKLRDGSSALTLGVEPSSLLE